MGRLTPRTDADRLRQLEEELAEEMAEACEGAPDPEAAKFRYLADRIHWLLSGPDGREMARIGLRADGRAVSR